MARNLLVCLVSLILSSVAVCQEGRLGRVREEVRRPEPPAEPAPSDRNARSDDCRDEDHDDSIFGWLIGGLIHDLFTPDPDAEAKPEIENYQGPHYSPRYPYRRGYPGFLTVHPDVYREVADYWKTTPMKSWWGAFSLEGGSDLDDVHRLGIRATLDSTSRFGVITGWNFYHEKLANRRTDDLSIGDGNLTFRIWQCHNIQAHLGLGLRWLNDRSQTDFGFNAYLGANYFPIRPVVISASLDAGTLGDANVLHLRTTVGLVRKHWEVFSGYDFLSIGDVDLQGPLVGVRVWF